MGKDGLDIRCCEWLAGAGSDDQVLRQRLSGRWRATSPFIGVLVLPRRILLRRDGLEGEAQLICDHADTLAPSACARSSLVSPSAVRCRLHRKLSRAGGAT